MIRNNHHDPTPNLHNNLQEKRHMGIIGAVLLGFHSRLDGNALEGGQKWFARCKSVLLKDIVLQRYHMCLQV